MPSTTIYNARCAYCDAHLGKRRVKEGHKNTFCNHSCQAEHQRVVRFCKQCGDEITSKSAKVFCNQSCAASFNNRGVRRHGNPPNDCLHCGVKTSGSDAIYCSNRCQKDYEFNQRWDNKEDYLRHKAAINREAVARYNARKKSQTPELSKKELKSIQKFYEKCPEGYEVDHIYPIAKGGQHVFSNLQYLTIKENRKKQDKVLDNTSPIGYN